MPNGWSMEGIERLSDAETKTYGGRWLATAGLDHRYAGPGFKAGVTDEMEVGYGNYPETALLDLARLLEERIDVTELTG